MARLYEFQGKKILEQFKIPIPRGKVVSTPEEGAQFFTGLGKPVVVKAQTWTTGRASSGGIKFSNTVSEVKKSISEILGMKFGGVHVEQVLVEEKLDIDREFYAGLVVDDSAHAPALIFSSRGGTGIEEIAREYPGNVSRCAIDIFKGLRPFEARNLVNQAGIKGKLINSIASVLVKLYKAARTVEARSAEINPLVLTTNGEVIAADCHVTIDDYAVFRHPELDIEIARELDRPATDLEKIAYQVESGDYRGTFYFLQLVTRFKKGDGVIGFHGAGGGGSMMSMDAVLAQGYKLANFCDTSGNPPASKVYRAAKIILAQGDIDGYFASGSGVASQEQFHSARGLVKAFREEKLSIPAIIRLGGNSEEKAIQIITEYTRDLAGIVEGYGKDDSPDFCAKRLKSLIDKKESRQGVEFKPRPVPPFKQPYTFESLTGKITFDHAICASCETKVCVEECVPQILKLEDGKPMLSISPEDAKKGKCTECLVCEVECWMHGAGGGYVDLPIPGLNEYKNKKG